MHAAEKAKPCKVSMFRHSLISNYILSVFSKLPVHPMNTLRHAREQVIYRVLVSTYARRINARYIDSDEQFHAIDFEIANSSRESSCVVALTVTAEPKHWEQATRVAVQVRSNSPWKFPNFFLSLTLEIRSLTTEKVAKGASPERAISCPL